MRSYENGVPQVSCNEHLQKSGQGDGRLLRGREPWTILAQTLGGPMSGLIENAPRFKRLIRVIGTLRFAEGSFRVIVRYPTKSCVGGAMEALTSRRTPRRS